MHAPHRLALIALLLAAGSAQAQNVTIYGIADLAVEHLTRINPAGDSIQRMPNLSGSVPSRLGLRGSEDLGGGLRAIFQLEGGIGMDTGGLGNGGRFWGRMAFVGLSGPWGTLSLGRMANMTFAAAGIETLGGNLYSNASLDPYIPNARSDNSIGYQGQLGAFSLGATYSLGRDTVNGLGPAATNCAGESADSKACQQWTLMVRYDSKPYGLALVHDRMHGGPGATMGLGSSAYTDMRNTINGYLMLGQTKLTAGALLRERRNATNFESTLLFAGASHPLSPQLTLDAQLSRLDVKRSADDAQLLAARLVYALSKRSAVYAMAGQMRNRGRSALSLSAGATVGMGMTQSGLAMGVRQVF